MATPIDQVLDTTNLIGMIQDVIGAIPGDLLPTAFMTSGDSIEGTTGTYDHISSNRKSAIINQSGSPAQKVNLKGVSKRPITLIHSFEEQSHSAATLIGLRNEGTAGQQARGEQTVARQVKDFGSRFSNLRLSTVYSTLSKGAIYVDSAGGLLSSASGAAYTIDFSVPAGNQNQLNVNGDGAVIGASWATAATDIAGQIIELKARARKFTGYGVKHAFYGPNIPNYLLKNTTAKAAIAGSPRLSEQVALAEIPNGLFGLEWHPVNQAFFEQENGNQFDWFGGDQVTFTPDPSIEWWDILEGSEWIPGSLNLSSDASAALANLIEVTGGFSYAEMTTNPAGIRHFAGDNFSPVLKVAKAIFLANVIP